MAPVTISMPLLNDLVAQTAGQVPSSHPRRPDLANVDGNESGAGIPLIELNGPERRKVVAAIGRACESDGLFMFMVYVQFATDGPWWCTYVAGDGQRTNKTNHGVVPAPAGVVEVMLRVDGECGYSDDPNKARALLESLGLELEQSHMGRHEQPHMVVNYYGLHPHAIITQDQQDGVSGLQVQRVSRWVAVNNHPVPANSLVINIGDQMQVTNDTVHFITCSLRLLLLACKILIICMCVLNTRSAIGLSTSFNVRPHYCYPLESFVDQYPPSSFRAACNVSGENIHRVIQRCVHCSSPSYCLPITVNDPSPHGSETESPFSPLVILEKNDVKVKVITDEATADEDVSKFDLATIAGTLSLVVPVAINIDELTTTWAPLWKVVCGIFMIMSLMLAFIGLFTASFRSGSRARNLSSHCARMSLVLATVVFMLLIASKLGCVGCAAGVTIVLVMLVLTILWIRCENEI